MKKLIIHTDGGARGNPGPAGIGVLIEDDQGNVLYQEKKYLGHMTNNQAEYEAVIAALKQAKKLAGEELEIYLDSELIVEQLNRNYKIKNLELGKLFIKVWNLSQDFKKVNFIHVRREANTIADKLVNQAIDEALK